MDVRRTTYVLLLVLMLSVAVPVAMGGDSDAAEQSDVIVNVDGSGDSITLDMESGTSKTATLYITNNSDSYLSLDVPTYDSDLISSSAKITVNGAESNLIYPKGDPDGRHIAVVTITVSVDRLTDTQTVEGNLTLRFTDVTVESTDGSNVFERQVPFTVNVNSVYTSEGSYNQFFGLFPNTLPAPLNEPWFTAVVTLVLWIVITIVVCELVIPQLTKIVGSRKTATEKKKLTQTLTKTISVLMFVVAVNECLNIIGTNAEIMSMVSTWSLVLYVIIGVDFFAKKGEGLLIPQNPYLDLAFFLRIRYPKPTNKATHTIKSENMIAKPAPNIPISVNPSTISPRIIAQITRNRNILNPFSKC